jgi:hypothetical protein
MNIFTKKALKNWGVEIIDRPDIFDGRNRCVAIIIDERIDDVVFIDPLTLTMSSDTVDELVVAISAHICDDFMALFIHAINIYGKWMKVVIKQQKGTEWWKQAIERVECILEMYKVNIKRFQKLDYEKCVYHFGSRRAFHQIIIDAIAYNIDDFPKCLICKHCKCKRDGQRVCNKVFTPVEEDGVKTLRMITDYPISNRIEDIQKTFTYQDECIYFEQNQSDLIDWMLRFRNAHF